MPNENRILSVQFGSGTPIPIGASTTDTVRYVSQSLTAEQKLQARTNIGAASTADLPLDGATITETTYAALKALRDNDGLTPGALYRITDYETIINGSYDLSQFGITAYIHYAVSAGHRFDVIVLATGSNELLENAWAAHHEGDSYFANANLGAWQLKYCLDNDNTKYTWANANGKGVIQWMKDEWNNQAGYDFKNIQFLRYALKLADATEDYIPLDVCGFVYNSTNQPNRYGTPQHVLSAFANSMGGAYINPFSRDFGETADYDFAVGASILAATEATIIDAHYLSTYQADLYYAFDYFDTATGEHADASLNRDSGISCTGNHLQLGYDYLSSSFLYSYSAFGLNGSVFENNDVVIAQTSPYDFVGCSGNKLKSNSFFNTFGAICTDNIFGNRCANNMFGNECKNNTFGNECTGNMFRNECKNNTFGDQCVDNTFRGGHTENTFGDSCSNNIIRASGVTFGKNCSYNQVLFGCSGNTFGDDCESNIVDNDSYGNTFGGGCSHNTLENRCQGNTFSDGCKYNTLTYGCKNGNLNHVSGTTFNNGKLWGAAIPHNVVSYDGVSGHATVITERSVNTRDIYQTTDGGTTWTGGIGIVAVEIVIEVSGTTPTITPAANTYYKCGELTNLTISNPPATGSYSIVFTSGSTATTTTIPATVLGLEDFAAEADTIYEINVLDNRAVVGSWAVSGA